MWAINSTAKTWSAHVKNVSLLCQINTIDDRPSFADRINSLDGFVKLTHINDGSWTYFKIKYNNVIYNCAYFVKKLIITLDYNGTHPRTLNSMLTWGFSKTDAMKELAVKIAKFLSQKNYRSIRTYPLIDCAKLEPYSSHSGAPISPEWVGDGLTTFSLKAFDSRQNRAGIIRVSRHIAILFGLTPSLTVDVANLIYEKMLYKPADFVENNNTPLSDDQTINEDQVFELLSALGNYVLPTEFNLFSHRFTSKIAIFAVAAGVIFSLVSFLQGRIPVEFLAKAFPDIHSFVVGTVIPILVLYMGAGLACLLVWRIAEKWISRNMD